MGNRDGMKSLRSSLEKTEEKLKETERQLEAAQAENRSLKHQVQHPHTNYYIYQAKLYAIGMVSDNLTQNII